MVMGGSFDLEGGLELMIVFIFFIWMCNFLILIFCMLIIFFIFKFLLDMLCLFFELLGFLFLGNCCCLCMIFNVVFRLWI